MKINAKTIACCLSLLLLSTANAELLDKSNPNTVFPVIENPKLSAPANEWGDIKKPYPTSAWFNNLAIKGEKDELVGLQPLFPYPYTIRSSEQGLKIDLPKPSFVRDDKEENKVFAEQYAFDAKMGLAFDSPSSTPVKRKITHGNELSVTLQYNIDDNHYFYSPIVRGSPYISMYYHDVTPLIIPYVGLRSVNNQHPGTPIAASKRFEIVINLGVFNGNEETQTWVLYSSQPITLEWKNTPEGWRLKTTTAYTGWLRLALQSDTLSKVNNSAATLDQYANNIPLKGEVRYQYDHANVTTIFQWETNNQQPPLLMTLPHQRSTLEEHSLHDVKMKNVKGIMYGVASQQWTMKESLPAIHFLETSNTHSFTKKQKHAIENAIEKDAANINESLSPDYGVYTSGKRFARAARLALLADLFEKKELANHIVTTIEKNLEQWMRGEKKFRLYYDTTYGGIIPKVDDFGSQDYNDHHFHYGYFAYTFAVMAKMDPVWFNTTIKVENQHIKPSQWIAILVRDYANPMHDDPFFPYSRHSDAFDGHSWASGLGVGWGDGRNQESISEAVNAYYGAALLSQVAHDDTLSHWSKMLLARELRGAHTYWQISSSSDIYDKPYTENYSVVVNMWGGKVDGHSWFGSNKDFSYGIEMIPFTAASFLLLDNHWAKEIHPILTSIYQQLPMNNVGWKWFILKGRLFGASHHDLEDIWAEAMKEGLYDEGDSQANTLYMIAVKMHKK